MDIVKEILQLPNFGYVFTGHDDIEHTAILGGQSCKSPEKCEFMPSNTQILRIHDSMVDIYSKSDLSVEEKTQLAILMKKMMTSCFTRLPGNYTHEEQTNYLNGLTEAERKQIEQQVQMYKDCRCFYRDYVHQ